MQQLKRLLIFLIPILIVALARHNRLAIYDWYRLRGYNPPQRIVALADDTKMTEQGRRLFYVTHPELNDKTAFNQNCTISEQSIILGCYVSGGGIYIYDVTDQRLLGIHQVTAAHELLHAAYDRLGDAERTRINALTEEVFEGLNDERIKNTLVAYQERDPTVVPNELHSILATEVEVLPTELEEYYRRYFSDRQTVVRYSKQYEAAFSERKAKIAAYDQQLQNLKQQIESLEASLASQERELAAERQRLEAMLSSGRNSEYNAAVPGFNSRVRSYNASVAKIRSLIEEHNSIVAARNAIAIEENELVEAIDSRPDTIQTQ